MADGGGNGGVRWRPEPLSHRRWTGGVEGGAVEERAWHSGVDEDDGVKKGKMGKRGGAGPTRAAGLWRDRSGQQGAVSPARAQLTDGVGRSRGPVVAARCGRE
jgi:hypothetical protein